MKNKNSRTKIVATVGPACSSKEVLKSMIQEGVDVFRLNFSHSRHEEHMKIIQFLRELNKEMNCHVAILADLQGPKLRIGEVENNMVMLEEGKEVVFNTEAEFIGNSQKLYMSYRVFPQDVKQGDIILIDDGKIRLEAIESDRKNNVRARIINGGPLSSKKGVNLPDTKVSLPSLTEKDIKDAHFALDNDVDWIALSFVRSASDIMDLRELMKEKKKHTGIIAKIEKPEALLQIDQIIDIANGIMVARGDMGVEVPFDRVPMIQKQIAEKCIKASKPVIIATQMMESMITNFRPTRAEATDVANAVMDGADALMLSGETSVGKFPVGVITAMRNIIDYTEKNGFQYNREHAPKEMAHFFFPDSICANACIMADQTGASAIAVFTFSGYTAFRISSHRPKAKIFAFTRSEALQRKLSLVWGVDAFYYDKSDNIDDAIRDSTQMLKESGMIKDEDVIIHIGSTPIHARGQTNLIKLGYV